MPGISTCPQVMASLVAWFSTVPLNDPSDVRYGPQPTNSEAREVISVGLTGPLEDAAVENTTAQEGLMPSYRENYTIHCAVAVLQGDGGPQPAAERAFVILAACTALVNANSNLAGDALNLSVASWALREDQTTGGISQRLRFDVNVDAFMQ